MKDARRATCVNCALAVLFGLAASSFGGCSGAVAAIDGDAGMEADATPVEAGTSQDGANDAAAADATASSGGDDGSASRGPCTSSFGRSLSTAHGRLDGFLVSIVAPSGKACNADSGHVHLQVRMNAAVYDVAVTIVSDQGSSDPNVYLLEKDLALPGEPWSEGWHTANASLDYVTTLGVHAADFTAVPKAVLAQRMETALASANHVSIYGTGYGPDGAHKVHRNTTGMDGMIVIHPTTKVAHAFLFHFGTQSF